MGKPLQYVLRNTELKTVCLMYACLQKAITVVIDRRWASDL